MLKDVIVDTSNFVTDVKKLRNALVKYSIEVKRIQASDSNASNEILKLVSSGSCRKFAVLVNVGDPLKKIFPNNSIEINGTADYANRFQKIANSIEWILSNSGKEKPMDGKTWFTSDSHFGHGNIIKYCDRPWKSGAKDGAGELIITEKNIYDMNEAIIANWNSVIAPNDIVWHLGDFALGNRNRIPQLVARLNGRKHLVLGNHDYFHVDEKQYKNVVDFFYKAGFEKVYDHPVLLDSFVVLSHEPMSFVKAPWFNIYGHVHQNDLFRTFSKSGCCVCVERHNYTPISWEEIYKKCSDSE